MTLPLPHFSSTLDIQQDQRGWLQKREAELESIALQPVKVFNMRRDWRFTSSRFYQISKDQFVFSSVSYHLVYFDMRSKHLAVVKTEWGFLSTGYTRVLAGKNLNKIGNTAYIDLYRKLAKELYPHAAWIASQEKRPVDGSFDGNSASPVDL